MKTTGQGAKDSVLYDEHCPFCVAQMRLLKRLDWWHAFAAVPMSDPTVAELIPGVSRGELLEAMRYVTRDGRVYEGARGFRHLALRVPLLIPLALLLWVPGLIHVAEWVYRRIARNRYVLSRILKCDGATCGIDHPGQFEDKEKSRAASVRS